MWQIQQIPETCPTPPKQWFQLPTLTCGESQHTPGNFGSDFGPNDKRLNVESFSTAGGWQPPCKLIHLYSFHIIKNIRTSVCLRKAFQKRGLGKWLEPWKFYEFLSSDRTNAAWIISFSEKRAAVSLCRLFLCSRWNLPLRCWQSQMKLKVSWIGSFDELPMRCELTIWSCAICAPKLG